MGINEEAALLLRRRGMSNALSLSMEAGIIIIIRMRMILRDFSRPHLISGLGDVSLKKLEFSRLKINDSNILKDLADFRLELYVAGVAFQVVFAVLFTFELYDKPVAKATLVSLRTIVPAAFY